MPESPPSSIEAALKDRMLRDSALTALIGQRVYPCYVPPNGGLPCIVYQRTRTERKRQQHASGVGSGNEGLPKPTIELRLYSWDYDQTKAIFKEVRRLWDGFKGAHTVAATTFHFRSSFIDEPGESDDFEPSPFADDTVVFFCRVPLLICCTEAVTDYVT